MIKYRHLFYDFIRGIFEKLARWYANLKHWQAVWQVGKFIGAMTHKNEKLTGFWYSDTQARWYVNYAGT